MFDSVLNTPRYLKVTMTQLLTDLELSLEWQKIKWMLYSQLLVHWKYLLSYLMSIFLFLLLQSPVLDSVKDLKWNFLGK